MSKVEEAARKLRGRYLEGLPAKRKVVEAAIQALRGESVAKAEAQDTLHRLAHQIRGSAASYGFAQIDAAADELEHATNDASIFAAADALVRALAQAHAAESPRTTRILLVDDDPEIGEVVDLLLADENILLTQITSATAARPELENGEWDLIFVDLILPDADGRTLLTELRSYPNHRDTPLIVLSSKTGSLVKNECAMYGIDAFMEKPIDPATFAVGITSVLTRSRSLRNAAYDDDPSGLPNRVGFRRAFEPLQMLAASNGQPLSLALLDIDQLDRLNKVHGRRVGDEAITSLTRALRECLRRCDVIGRWGGEEFVVGLPELDAEAAAATLHEVADTLRGAPLGPGIDPLTFSAGVVQLRPDEALDFGLLRADQLLDQAKRGGRDQIAHVPEAARADLPTILVAEDDPGIAALLLHDLSEDFTVTHVPNGDAAIEAATAARFDVVLLDYQMPGRDGVAVVRALRQRPEYRETPILLLTAVGSDAAVEAAFAAGADDYISKPHSGRALRARLSRHLGRSLGQPKVSAQSEVNETVVTALFCDISGFSEIAAKLAPRDVVALLKSYFPVIADVVFRHDGTLEKYIGDAILAVWGTPARHDDDVSRALRAAVEIQHAVAELEHGSSEPLQVHIGLNSGPVAAANIGSRHLLQYATIGDATNLASRVCDIAGPGEIALGATTVEMLDGTSPWPLDGPFPHRIKGRDQPISVYKLRWS
ncbi:Adenylate cyclase 2 [Enhygromyxa salina]|uniref:Adenylate cyclase 2 n=1 Tax=Enhygromyxa salina TaxID=215803 RepID=A0A2S9YJT9_9BACT|nr:response regulator [Enhygromyxa salina]PRQ05377.1 Adenylate cyclase 2 [Enhygromyxa salina]